MKLFNRVLVSPVGIWIEDIGMWTNDRSNHPLYININGIWLWIWPIQKTGGTCRTTSLVFQFGTKNWSRQLTLCWRPDVSYYNYDKELYFKNKTKVF